MSGKSENYIKVDDAMKIVESKDVLSHDDIMLIRELWGEFSARNWVAMERADLENRRAAIESKWYTQNNP